MSTGYLRRFAGRRHNDLEVRRRLTGVSAEGTVALEGRLPNDAGRSGACGLLEAKRPAGSGDT